MLVCRVAGACAARSARAFHTGASLSRGPPELRLVWRCAAVRAGGRLGAAVGLHAAQVHMWRRLRAWRGVSRASARRRPCMPDVVPHWPLSEPCKAAAPQRRGGAHRLAGAPLPAARCGLGRRGGERPCCARRQPHACAASRTRRRAARAAAATLRGLGVAAAGGDEVVECGVHTGGASRRRPTRASARPTAAYAPPSSHHVRASRRTLAAPPRGSMHKGAYRVTPPAASRAARRRNRRCATARR
jgi:hypothetical protein